MSKHLEHDIQAQCLTWFRLNYPSGLMFSVPNAQVRSCATLAYQKAEGLTLGAPDTIIVLPNGIIAFIEFKTPRGRQSVEQVKIQEKLDAINEDIYWVCRSLDDFKTVITYLNSVETNAEV